MARRSSKPLTVGRGGFYRGGKRAKAPRGVTVRRDAAGRTLYYLQGERVPAARIIRRLAALEGAKKSRRSDTLYWLRAIAAKLGLSVRREGVGFAVRVKNYQGDFESASEKFDDFSARLGRRRRDLLVAPNVEIDVTPPAPRREGKRRTPGYTIDRRGTWGLQVVGSEPGPGTRMMMGLSEILKHVGAKGYAADVANPELSVYFSRRLPPRRKAREAREAKRSKERRRYRNRR
jgi:hypothetical protein